MNNHWLSSIKKKKLFRSIDDIGMEVWSEDGTLGDFLSMLSSNEKKFFLSLNLSDFVLDKDDETFRLELTPTN